MTAAILKLPKASEEDECIALMDWATRQSCTIRELRLLFHIPNGSRMTWKLNDKGKRYSVAAQKMLRMGLRPGVHDYLLPVPRKYVGKLRAGLWIEMKVKGRPLSSEQKWWENEMIEQGFACATCYTWLQARDVLIDYLGVEGMPVLSMYPQ